ncbi:MAG: hypothetical protein ACP5OO_13605 [Chloroflexia bacterium]
MAIQVVWSDVVKGMGWELWEVLPFTLYLRQPPTEEQQRKVQEVIAAWAKIGYYGGFEGVMFCDPEKVTFTVEGENLVEWDAEMERLPDPQLAVDILVRCLERVASEHGLEVERLVLGGEEIE